MGFKKVMDILFRARKPLIGHNFHLDLMYLYQHFIAELPETLEQFSKNVQAIFPVLLDTRYLAFNHPEVSRYVRAASLHDISSKLKSFFPEVRVYGSSQAKSAHGYHDAGYDAVQTGKVYLAMENAIQSHNKNSSIDCRAQLIDFGNHIINVHNCIVPAMSLQDLHAFPPRPLIVWLLKGNLPKQKFMRLLINDAFLHGTGYDGEFNARLRWVNSREVFVETDPQDALLEFCGHLFEEAINVCLQSTLVQVEDWTLSPPLKCGDKCPLQKAGQTSTIEALSTEESNVIKKAATEVGESSESHVSTGSINDLDVANSMTKEELKDSSNCMEAMTVDPQCEDSNKLPLQTEPSESDNQIEIKRNSSPPLKFLKTHEHFGNSTSPNTSKAGLESATSGLEIPNLNIAITSNATESSGITRTSCTFDDKEHCIQARYHPYQRVESKQKLISTLPHAEPIQSTQPSELIAEEAPS
jgi:hypothetical protein